MLSCTPTEQTHSTTLVSCHRGERLPRPVSHRVHGHVPRVPLSWVAGNYRSALMDCAQALKCNPGQVKAIYRAGKACFELGKFAEVVRWCDQGLACDTGSASLLELRSRAAKQQVLTPDVGEALVERDLFTCSLLPRKCWKGTNAKRVRRPRRRQQKQRHFLQPSRCVFVCKI